MNFVKINSTLERILSGLQFPKVLQILCQIHQLLIIPATIMSWLLSSKPTE